MRGSYQEKSSAEIENQGPARAVTLKQGDIVDENELAEYDVEIEVQDNRGCKASIGKYRTAVENYVLCVDVRNRDLSNVLFLHIEFKGKVSRMKICPRCHKKTLEPEQARNSLSRRGDVYICNPCGDEEALIDSGNMLPTETEKAFTLKLQSEPDLP